MSNTKGTKSLSYPVLRYSYGIWGTISPGVPNPRDANVIRGDLIPLGIPNHQ